MGLTIHVVEDNDMVRELLVELLSEFKHDVTASADVAQALAQLQARDFDVLMTDVQLGAESGIEMAQRVLQTRPQQWVIFCSGYALPSTIETMGSNVRSILKPFEEDDLLALLQQATDQLNARH